MNDRNTHPVSDAVFRRVYDSPASLPGKQRWLTGDADVRQIEKLLGMPARTIGAPLWVSGDRKTCPKCRREINWLDIVSSALSKVHAPDMIAQAAVGERRAAAADKGNGVGGLVRQQRMDRGINAHGCSLRS